MTSLSFASFFSGIGGFEIGLNAAGHRCVYACEIKPFPRAVYEARFGRAPEGKDVTSVQAREIPDADLWCGGFPCQNLSSAGLRAGIYGPESGLVWRLLALAARRKPTWLLLENVPGLLTGRDDVDGTLERDGEALGAPAGNPAWFGALLGALRELGYVGAYRTLDAVQLGVAQYRRRVFVLARRARAVGPDPGAVLLEASDRRRNLAPCLAPRAKAANAAALSTRGSRFSSDEDEVLVGQHARTLRSSGGAGGRSVSAESAENRKVLGAPDFAGTLRASDGRRRSPNGDANANLVLAFDPVQVTSRDNRSRCEPGAPSGTLGARTRQHVAYNVHSNGSNATTSFGLEAAASRCLETRGGGTSETLVLFDVQKNSHGHGVSTEASAALRAQHSSPHAVEDGVRVRRLTPLEWERLMGFPDLFTAVPWRGRPVAADSPRYEALGNAVVPAVVRWIGERLARLA